MTGAKQRTEKSVGDGPRVMIYWREQVIARSPGLGLEPRGSGGEQLNLLEERRGLCRL